MGLPSIITANLCAVSGAWTTFLNYHNIHWGSYSNPLQVGNERAAVVYLSRFIEPVLTEMNRLRQAQHFAVSTSEYVFAVRRQPRIRITGYCGYVITCNGEHTRHEEDGANFNRGIDQAIVYAAAIAHQHGQQLTLAIVTDLRR